MFGIFKKEKRIDPVDKWSKAAQDLVHSNAWLDIQQMFLDKIMDTQSVMNIDDSSMEKAVMDMKVRVNLAKDLKDILDRILAASSAYEFNNQKKEEELTHIDIMESD
jgi:hypothetical protein